MNALKFDSGPGLVIGAAIVAASVAGCGQPSPEVIPSWAPAFASAIEDATQAGVDPSQLEILTRVANAGVVTVQDVREALESTYQCLDDAGISYREELLTNGWGLDVVAYTMAVPPGTDVDAAVAVSDECAKKYSDFVAQLYVNQPAYVEGAERYRNETILPGVRACMDSFGAPYDPAAGFEETWDTAIERQGVEWEELGGPGPFTECVLDVGEGDF